MESIVAPAIWDERELAGLQASYDLGSGLGDAVTKYNPTPGTGRTGFLPVPPNNYPFYNEDEKYVPMMQADGGQLSEWKPMYQPTPEQAEADRRAAYESGVPHGYVAPGDKYKGLPTIKLVVVSNLHTADEYGSEVGPDGLHRGGPFTIEVSPKMRVEELRIVIRDKGGIIPGLQQLAYAGKNMDDSQRTLEHYGIAYWHAKFPHWPLVVRRY
ncbi:hypothetical protein D9Q98_001616 [Chlorella vulgaris]|uniref:Ubiquitin-like domain-containing protein n=1 Tax=Chlorella vulgaris TaxID=3077 RepID=A0A9D4TUP0_CHLVU|nr:hypothetical protein D9Q98_001616 [Chlorella vulgaris]